MSSHAGHVTTETVFGQTLARWLGNRDEHRALESDTTGLNVKGNLYLLLSLSLPILFISFIPLFFLEGAKTIKGDHGNCLRTNAGSTAWRRE